VLVINNVLLVLPAVVRRASPVAVLLPSSPKMKLATHHVSARGLLMWGMMSLTWYLSRWVVVAIRVIYCSQTHRRKRCRAKRDLRDAQKWPLSQRFSEPGITCRGILIAPALSSRRSGCPARGFRSTGPNRFVQIPLNASASISAVRSSPTVHLQRAHSAWFLVPHDQPSRKVRGSVSSPRRQTSGNRGRLNRLVQTILVGEERVAGFRTVPSAIM